MKTQPRPTSAAPRTALAAAFAATLLLSLPASPIRGQSHPCGAVPPNPPNNSWSFLGPLAINDGQVSPSWTRTTVNGRINSVAFNPHAPKSDVWVATAGGGVWHFDPVPKNESQFDQWQPMTDDQESLATGALALDSCTVDRCATVWVGGGENSIRRDTQYGASTDADQSSPFWTRLDDNGIGLPDRPVSSIAVHPADREEIFVAFNGFGEHSVYRSTNAGATWHVWDQTIDNSTVLAERPANRLVIEPEPPYQVWLGTDSCVYSRPAEPLSAWQYAGQGMPNVAVYDFDLDADRGLLYAGTHGRGVWQRELGDAESGLLKIFNWEKCCAFWIDTGDPPGPPVHDPAAYVAVSAVALEPDAACTLRLEQIDGSVCAETQIDAGGATLRTDRHGALVADKEGVYTGQPAAWACYDGQCAGGVPADECELASITVACGETEARADAMAPHVTADPGSALLLVTPTLAPGEGTATLTPTLAKAGEASEALCTVETVFDATSTTADLLAAMATAVNRDGGCIAAAGVTAEMLDSEPSEGEDAGGGEPALRLSAVALEGSQLVPAITGVTGARVELRGLGLPQWGQPVAPRLSLSTPEAAAGGTLRVTEVTSYGRCTMEVETVRGDDETTIAARLQDSFLAPPGEDPEVADCPINRNLRDAARRGASLQFPLARGLMVETDDSGLSIRLDSQ